MKKETFVAILTYARFLFAEALPSKLSEQDINASLSSRILNGETANPEEFPFLVRLHKNRTLCAGTVVDQNWILTAGHCVFDQECTSIPIFPSTWRPKDAPNIHPVQCHPHERFTGEASVFDIALIKTREDLLEDGKLGAIPLPTPGTKHPPGTKAMIVGWGKTENGTFPHRLLRGDVLVQDWNTCNKRYHENTRVLNGQCRSGDLPSTTICTEGQSSEFQGICHGDSGGPLLVNGVLAGVSVATFLREDGACKLGTPSVYTNVTDYLPWIYSIIEPDKDIRTFPVDMEDVYGT